MKVQKAVNQALPDALESNGRTHLSDLASSIIAGNPEAIDLEKERLTHAAITRLIKSTMRSLGRLDLIPLPTVLLVPSPDGGSDCVSSLNANYSDLLAVQDVLNNNAAAVLRSRDQFREIVEMLRPMMKDPIITVGEALISDGAT